ncbi:dienelactone hydrolase family protein [Candidatus Poribacteria bacterium]|nr:dienelactone hydrolase family protein [Candidatus Poribacteria bacterium]
MLIFIAAVAPLIFALPGQADEPPHIEDERDQQILEAFLDHVQQSARECTPERMAKFAEQPEDITWQASKYIRMPLIAYRLTGDGKYLDLFVARMDTLLNCLKLGPDGFLGWYGLPLQLFRHPDYPERHVDVMLTSFVMAGLMAEFATVVLDDNALNQRFGDAARRYLKLAEEHLVRKWDARGRYKDLGKMGAVYITHPDLNPVKASLTQPHNKHAKIISALLDLYAATGKDEYLVKAIKLGTRFKRCLTLAGDHYQWHYWDPAGEWDINPQEPGKWKHWIGAEHTGGYYSLSLSLVLLLYAHGLVFDQTDIDRFITTQMTVCWNGDLKNPKWARVDGQPSESPYLCGSLAPFDERINEIGYGAPAQQRRLEQKGHGWHGGPVAGDWLEFKYLILPRWKNGAKVALNPDEIGGEKAVVSNFLAKPENRAWVEELAFEVKAPGYRAPMSPTDGIELQRVPTPLPDTMPQLSLRRLIDDEGQPITTDAGWMKERDVLRKKWHAFMGEFPKEKAPLKAEVLETEETPDFIRQHVRYQIEAGVFTDGYLLTPKDATGKLSEATLPAIVVFHQTVATHAKQAAGIDPSNPELMLGAQLVKRGYIVLCPRCFIFDDGADYVGNVQKMQGRHPDWKGMARMAYDGVRAVDYLESLPNVDKTRIGGIGHSLGAKEVLYAAAFDERYKVAIFSEGGIGLTFSNWDAIWYLSDAIKAPDFNLEHHQLMALIAPRPFLLLAGDSADNDKSWAFVEAVMPVYQLLGVADNIGWFNHHLGHRYPLNARAVAESFLDQYLKMPQ